MSLVQIGLIQGVHYKFIYKFVNLEILGILLHYL